MANKPGLLRRLFAHTILLLNILAVVWLFLCQAASFISPRQFKYLALFSLTSPFAIAVNFLFVLYWLFTSRKKRSLLSFITLVLCFQLFNAVVGWHYLARNDMKPGPGKLKVMTWNIHGLGIYDKPVDPATDDKIIDIIARENPDIVCLPEFYTIYSNALKPYSTAILKRCGYKEYRFKDDNSLGVKIYLGTAIFSKYPIRAFKDIPLAKHVYLLQCDVRLPDNQTLRTYFIHLQSFMLTDRDKSLIEDVKHREKDVPYTKTLNYVKRFGMAYERRATQADSAAKMIAESPYPVVICGDFNDLPGSYTYQTMKGKLRDVFAEKGRGFGRTYNLFLPTLRIDYIFYDHKFLKLVGYKSFHTNLSDHNPVIVNFELPQKP